MRRRNDKMSWLFDFVLLSAFLALTGAFSSPTFGMRRLSICSSYDTRLCSMNDVFMESLKARQVELEKEKTDRQRKWKSAECATKIPVVFPDWVRRIDVDYPLVAAGSASSAIFVAHLETGQLLAQSSPTKEERDDAHNQQESPLNLNSTLLQLYGSYDGGGTLSIAVHRNLICSSNRSGSVQVHRFDKDSNQLVFQGDMLALQGALVTSVQLDDEYLYVGTSDGRLLVYPHSEAELPLVLQTEPFMEWNFHSSVLDISIHPDLNYGAVCTAKGSVELVNLDDDGRIVVAWYPPFDSGRASRNVVPTCVTLLQQSNQHYSMACGGSDGSLFLHPLNWDTNNNCLDEDRPLNNGMMECKPKHIGGCQCLTSPGIDMLVSGGQDGTVRLWNVDSTSTTEKKTPTCQYQFLGYKVWLGSLWTDGSKLVSDGADNTIILHDFGHDGDDQDGEGGNLPRTSMDKNE